jgi:hypothetical protein
MIGKSLASLAFIGAVGTPIFLEVVDKEPRVIDRTELRADTIYGDVVYRRFEFLKTENVFQDRLGITLNGVSGSNGVNAGACAYSVLRPTEASISRTKPVDAEAGVTIGNSLYNVTVKDPTPASGGGFSGQPYVAPSCGIRIASYGTESVPSPLGSAVLRIPAQSYTGNFHPRQPVTLFDGGLTITVRPVVAAGFLYNNTGRCSYTAQFGNYEMNASNGVSHFMDDNGATYRVDASQNMGGFSLTEPCRLKVTRFERMSERTIYAPVQADAPRRGPRTAEEQIAQDFLDHNPSVNIRYGNVVETVPLQPHTTIRLSSDALHYQENSVTFQTEVAWERGRGNSIGTDASGNVSFFGLVGGTLGGSFEHALTNSVETKIQSGTTRTGGVNLDGSQCRLWETWVEGRRREAYVSAPSVGLRDEIRFTFTESVMMNARPLCDAQGRPQESMATGAATATPAAM